MRVGLWGGGGELSGKVKELTLRSTRFHSRYSTGRVADHLTSL